MTKLPLLTAKVTMIEIIDVIQTSDVREASKLTFPYPP